jgi:tRNA modification GTPase
MVIQYNSDTIFAPINALGGATVSIRISGPKAFDWVNTFFIPKNKNESLLKTESHRLIFGDIKIDNEVVDEVLVSVFEQGRSYTGEQTIEISFHASPYILNFVMAHLSSLGARVAAPGEFTLRAFLNGKMDLAQAESVADLIASTSKLAHRTAIKQMKGQYSDKLKNLRERLVNLASLLELELDFSEEDVEFADRSTLRALLNEVNAEVTSLVQSFKVGGAIKDGIPVAIIGEPNVGKSTLLNFLLQEEKAIVSSIAGTTRDFIEDKIELDGILFRFIDTAGLRPTEDEIEKIGINRSYQKIEQALVVLLMIDAREVNSTFNIDALLESMNIKLSNDQLLIIVVNKMDLNPEVQKYLWNAPFKKVFISAKFHQNLEQLELMMVDHIKQENLYEVSLVTNARHYEMLLKAQKSLIEVHEAIDLGYSAELLAVDLRSSLFYIGNITGQVNTEELLGNIFSKFCIGK